MFYQLTDNFAADCDAYDRWLADNVALCEDCGVDPENTSIDALYEVHGVRVCIDCLNGRYDDALGMEMVSEKQNEFVQFMYPDSDIDSALASDVWHYILYPKLKAELAVKRICPTRDYETLYYVEQFCLEDSDEWCEWLNKNT